MFEAIQGDDKIDDEQHSDHNRCLMISFKYSILCTLQAHVVIAFEKCGKCCFNDYKRLIWSFIAATLDELLRHIHPSKTSINRSSIIGLSCKDSYLLHPCIDFKVSVWLQVTDVHVHVRACACLSTFSIFMLQLSVTRIKMGLCKLELENE